jgi:hypothetical protein
MHTSVLRSGGSVRLHWTKLRGACHHADGVLIDQNQMPEGARVTSCRRGAARGAAWSTCGRRMTPSDGRGNGLSRANTKSPPRPIAAVKAVGREAHRREMCPYWPYSAAITGARNCTPDDFAAAVWTLIPASMLGAWIWDGGHRRGREGTSMAIASCQKSTSTVSARGMSSGTSAPAVHMDAQFAACPARPPSPCLDQRKPTAPHLLRSHHRAWLAPAGQNAPHTVAYSRGALHSTARGESRTVG